MQDNDVIITDFVYVRSHSMPSEESVGAYIRRRTVKQRDRPYLVTTNPISIDAYHLGVKAMEQNKYKRSQTVSVLPVVNQEHQFIGLLRLRDLVKAGLT